MPAYTIDGEIVSWNRSADGYRLPTEAEWEYACRTGTETPFNTQTSISAEEANYWGHYPYMIEDNYFDQGNLETQPGVYRETTVEVGSFSPNAYGLYDMHGNVGEWVWDFYGEYPADHQTDPTGPDTGTRRVNRGGGWNDFAGKTILPFCSHGGGRFGQSLTAIAKLVPDVVMEEGLAINYSGGSGMPADVTQWLSENEIPIIE